MAAGKNIYFERRLERLGAGLERTGADGLLVFSAEYDNRPTIQYFSGFTGSFAVLVLGRGGGRLVTDSRYFLQAEEESFFPLVKMEDRDPWPAVARAIGELGIEKLAVEDDRLTLERAGALKKIVPSVKSTSGLARRLRAVKDERELDTIRRSARVAAEAFEAFLPAIRPGRTEAPSSPPRGTSWWPRAPGAQGPTEYSPTASWNGGTLLPWTSARWWTATIPT